jgi:hypothetical protein
MTLSEYGLVANHCYMCDVPYTATCGYVAGINYRLDLISRLSTLNQAIVRKLNITNPPLNFISGQINSTVLHIGQAIAKPYLLY